MNRNRIGMLALQTVLAILLTTRAAQAVTETQKLAAGDATAVDLFGECVSVSGGLAIVGARLNDHAGGVNAGSAYVFTRTNGTWIQQEKLTADDAAADDQFGISVAISGVTAVVGASRDDDAGENSGSVYVFTYSSDVWSLQQKITAGNAAEGDHFGASVAVSGDTVVIAAPDAGSGEGRVYVINRTDGVWGFQQLLDASDATEGDYFGASVSTHENTLVVGAFRDAAAGPLSGSAYVFTRSSLSSTWFQQRKLTASDAAAGDEFGSSVSVWGDTIVVGADTDDSPGMSSGGAYVYTGSGGTWSEQQKLTASDAEEFEHFGSSVSLSGDTMVVGAVDGVSVVAQSGSAYVFTRSAGGEWSQQKKLTASDAAGFDRFGQSVSLSGDIAFVGAFRHDDGGEASGSAYAYNLVDKLTANDAALGDEFGISVSVSGDTALVGAYGDDNAGSFSGSAYVFTRLDGMWGERQKLTASDAEAGDEFGYSVSISGDTAVVSAWQDDDGGSAYVFTRIGGVWSQQDKLIASDAAAGAWFGYSVSVSGDTAVIGALLADDVATDSGSAYVFTRNGETWSQQQKLTPTGSATNDRIGAGVAVSGDVMLVGANGDESSKGSVFVFTRSGGVWSEQQTLSASDAANFDNFGASISMSGSTAIIGAFGNDDAGDKSGSAYVFTHTGGMWSQQQKLIASDAEAFDEFGASVSVSGDMAVIGAHLDDDGGLNSGGAYVFTRSNGVWSQQQKLFISGVEERDNFGISVSVSNGTAVVGASEDDDSGGNSGSAYIFEFDSESVSTSVIHTADQDANNLISLSELLRVIQFFNSGGLHCQDGTEDGYGPGIGDTSCSPHDSDYNAQDWEISLSELLRFIQFFNSNGYHACPDENTEDGYCPGVGPD